VLISGEAGKSGSVFKTGESASFCNQQSRSRHVNHWLKEAIRLRLWATKADADIANVLTMDGAGRIAVNIAKLPRAFKR